MVQKEGKALLRQCFKECGITAPLDSIIYYTTGTKLHACAYQHDEVPTSFDYEKWKPSMKYVIKCFIHFGVYAAWPIEVGLGNGKYINYKKDLVETEEAEDGILQPMLLDQNVVVYYFKGREGIKKFINTVLSRCMKIEKNMHQNLFTNRSQLQTEAGVVNKMIFSSAVYKVYRQIPAETISGRNHIGQKPYLPGRLCCL